jgi:transposase
MKGQGFKILDFSTYSPDLSPIENLWSALKAGMAADNPKTEVNLEKSLLKNWNRLTDVHNLEPYFTNLYDRYEKCIEKNGIKLDY